MFRRLLWLAAGASVLAVSACKKPAPVGAHPQSIPEPPLSEPALLTEAQVAAAPDQKERRPEALRGPAAIPIPAHAILGAYRAKLGASDRVELIAQLQFAAPTQAVQVIGELLALEKDVDLRVQLLDTLDVFEGATPPTLEEVRRWTSFVCAGVFVA